MDRVCLMSNVMSYGRVKEKVAVLRVSDDDDTAAGRSCATKSSQLT